MFTSVRSMLARIIKWRREQSALTTNDFVGTPATGSDFAFASHTTRQTNRAEQGRAGG